MSHDAAKRQEAATRLVVEVRGIGRWLASRVNDPALGHRLAAIALDPHLALGYDASGDVQHECAALAVGPAARQRVGGQAPGNAAPRGHAGPGTVRVGAEQADHVRLGDALHIAAEATDVVGIFDGYGRDSAVASAFQTHLYRLVHHHLTKSPVPVEHGRGGGLAHDFDFGVGNDLSLFNGAYVLGNADDAV